MWISIPFSMEMAEEFHTFLQWHFRCASVCLAQPGAARRASLGHSLKCWCVAPWLTSGEPVLSISPFYEPWQLNSQSIAPWSSGLSYSLSLHTIPWKLPQKLLHLFPCTVWEFLSFFDPRLGHCLPGPAQVPSGAVTFSARSLFPWDSPSWGILWNAPLQIVLALELPALATEFSFASFIFLLSSASFAIKTQGFCQFFPSLPLLGVLWWRMSALR